MTEMNVLNTTKIVLKKEDAAVIFREKEKSVEVAIPNADSKTEQAGASVILATYLAYACSTANPKVRKAMDIIVDECEKDMQTFLKDRKK